jgi:hypothetical protein
MISEGQSMHVLKYLATLSLTLVTIAITGCDDSAHRAWVLAGSPPRLIMVMISMP